MRTKCFVATCLGLASLLVAENATAQHIFLSGDINIANPLDGSTGAPGIDLGNQRFFQNILQSGTNVVVHNNTQIPATPTTINNFYNGLGGVTSTIFNGVVTNTTLASADLFVVSLPDDAYTAGEVASMRSFVNGGGSILFMGENTSFQNQNASINAVLTSLGTGMSILHTDFDSGYHTAAGLQIAVDPFTTGVNTFTYALPGQVALVSGGKYLFFGLGGQPFLAYTSIPEPATWLLALLACFAIPRWSRTRRA